MSLNLIIETGSYAGDGGVQTIDIGTGWQPAMVLIATTRSTGPQSQRGVCFKSDTMPGAFAAYSNNQDVDYPEVCTLLSNGFRVEGNETNHSGSTFYWTAIRASPSVDTGVYQGQGIGSTTVLTGRQPSVVFIASTTASPMLFGQKPSTYAGSAVATYDGSIQALSTLTLLSNGFTAEDNWDVDGQDYHWVALYDLVGSTRHFQTGTYTGTGGIRNISLGAQPKVVTNFQLQNTWAYKPDSAPDDDYAHLFTGYEWDTDFGISVVSDGFQVNLPWNQNFFGYRYMAGMR